MPPFRAVEFTTPSLEDVRKRARLLVIDDHEVPFLEFLTTAGYHIERWSKIENISQLTDAHYDLILLDLHGVGLTESPHLQGLGILKHIKDSNPAQLIIAYSAMPWGPQYQEFFSMADAVLEKDAPFIDFKSQIDTLLLRHYSMGYFITKMNEALGDNALMVPKAVLKAQRSMRRNSIEPLGKYLRQHLQDEVTIDRVIAIIGIAINLFHHP